jgi:hypothetical protein
MASQAPPLGAQMLQLLLQQNWSAAQVFFPQGSPTGTCTQAQTDGELSQTRSGGHSAGCLQTHMPPQSAPPLAGSQESVGSSTQAPLPGQGLAAKPPQWTCGTHSATGGQGAVTQTTGLAWQTVPGGQSAAAHGLVPVSGTHMGTGSQGAFTHVTCRSSQRWPTGHWTAAQPAGGGLHPPQVGHPLSSFPLVLPYGQ